MTRFTQAPQSYMMGKADSKKRENKYSVMKKLFLLLFLFLALHSCTLEHKRGKGEHVDAPHVESKDSDTKPKAEKERIFYQVKNIPPKSEFKKYNYFDEFTMRGRNNKIFTQKAYVCKKGKHIFVYMSDNPDSIITYTRYKDFWTNTIVREWDTKEDCLIKDGIDLPARCYDRLIKGGKIYELRTAYIESIVFKRLYVKTRNKCEIYELFSSDIEHESQPYDDILKLYALLKNQKEQLLKTRVYEQKRHLSIYIKKLQDKRAYYKELKEGYVLYPLRGVEDDLSSQPGLDNFVGEDVAEELLLIPSKKP